MFADPVRLRLDTKHLLVTLLLIGWFLPLCMMGVGGVESVHIFKLVKTIEKVNFEYFWHRKILPNFEIYSSV